MLGNFMYCNPTKLYFGEDSLASLNEELPKYGQNGSGDLIRRMLQSSHEGSCFMADIVFAPRQVARMDREFQHMIEIFVRIALGSMGR